MDEITTNIRNQYWMGVLQEWSGSGLSKREYCRVKGIHIKQLYYYQRKIRRTIAEHAAVRSDTGIVAASSSGNPPIVRLKIPEITEPSSGTVNFKVNGYDLSVPEDISAQFLSKLLEALGHGTR